MYYCQFCVTKILSFIMHGTILRSPFVISTNSFPNYAIARKDHPTDSGGDGLLTLIPHSIPYTPFPAESLEQWFLTLLEVLNPTISIHAFIPYYLEKQNVCREFYFFYFYCSKSLVDEPITPGVRSNPG